MIYLASPYSHPDLIIRKTRFLLARDFVAHIMERERLIIFSPIVYTHEMATHYQLPYDAQFWLSFNTNVLRRAESLFLLRINGWEESKGVMVELKLAKAFQIPVVEFDQNFNNLTEASARFGIPLNG